MKRRRGALFMPGNNPGMLTGSVTLGADAVIFDLEDSVAVREKQAARILARNALLALDRRGVEIMVRINSLDSPFWEDDVDAAVTGAADALVVPKCEHPRDVLRVAEHVAACKDRRGVTANIPLLPLLETALGIEQAFAVATAHPSIEALLFGGEDLATDLGTRRTKEGTELAYGRARVVMAAKAAKLQALDTVFTDTDDLEGLEQDALHGRLLGYDGKTMISPRHVAIINRVFQPSAEDVAWAGRVLAAARVASREGKGAVSLDGKMIDMPIIIRARRIMLQSGLPATSGEEEYSHDA
jgi:citrate lyase subunit beta/citryl-CoA lyase